MYSVSFFSKYLRRLFWSSTETSASANFFSKKIRLEEKVKITNKQLEGESRVKQESDYSQVSESSQWLDQ